MERAKQVLKPGGVAGLLLPTSILSNGGIYEAARDILLRYFRIKAIAVMGAGTFMATGTNTVILFMQRRENDEHVRIASLIEKYFGHWLDMTVAGQEDAFALYARSVWNVDLATFSALLRGDPHTPAHTVLSSYRKAFDEMTEIRTLREKNRQFKARPAIEQATELENRFRAWFCGREKEKMLTFFLVNGQQVVLARAPSEKNAEKAFLGYEFSNRKGSEGLKILSGTGQIETVLYSETNDADPDKINSLIRQNFLGETPAVPKALAEFVDVVPLSDLMTFDQVRFDLVIATGTKKKTYSGRWPLVKLGDVSVYMQRGKSPKYGKGLIQVIKSGQARGWRNFDFSTPHFLHPSFQVDPVRILLDGDLLINSTGVGTAGRVTLFQGDGKFTVDSHITIVRVDTARLSSSFLLAALGAIGFSTIEKMANGQSGQIELSLEIIKNITIPLLPLALQQKLVRRLSRIDRLAAAREECIQTVYSNLRQKVNALYASNTQRVRISDLFDVNKSNVVPEKVYGQNFFTYVDIAAVDGKTGFIDFSKQIQGNKAPSRARRLAKTSDILVSTVRPNLKSFAFLREQPSNCVYSTGFAIISSKLNLPEMNQMLFLLFNYSDDLMAQIEAKMPKQSYPSITQADILQFTITSSINNYQPFVAEVSALDSIANRHRKKLERLLTAKQTYLEKWLS